MRVLLDSRSAANPTGIGRYTRTLGSVLSGCLGKHEIIADHELLVFPSPTHEELELPAVLEREGVDAFHSPLFRLPSVLPPSVRAVITIHDAVPALWPELSTDVFARLWHDASEAAARADAVVCPTQAARADVIHALGLPHERVHVAPETPAAIFRPPTLPEQREARARCGLDDRPFVLVLGALERRKQPALALEALRARPHLPDIVFVGPAGAVDVAAEARRLGLSDRVRVLGAVPDAEVVGLLGTASALAFPTLAEGFGLPVVEAFATGTPVVASDLPAIREVAGDGAKLVPPGDAEALAAALLEVTSQPELAEALRERGRARLMSYSPDAVRGAFERLYDLLEEAP
ncbi:MAG: glycosyltransferase family 4 protein [Planctomycetes bacterium]|nr:glycosyltransferase family 4 protein [Planctomycetota bacterium]MCW8137401.1 glycosyltransferase family 4 protein [Planctomycetota bacterium]